MALQLHPEAAKRADEIAQCLLPTFVSYQRVERPQSTGYQPELFVAQTITPEDLQGPIIHGETDRFGREVSRYYSDSHGTWGLTGSAYAEFVKAVRTIHRQPSVRESVSDDSVSALVFEWVWKSSREGNSEPMVAYVLPRLEALVSDHDVIIPIHGLHVEQSFSIGRVVLADISEKEMEQWLVVMQRHAGQRGDDVARLHDQLRKKYQGRAAARFATRAEKRYAVHRAREEAELAVALLRLHSVGAFLPERPTNIALRGREYIPSAAYVMFDSSGAFESGEFLLHRDDLEPWILNRHQITKEIPAVLGHWSQLLVKSPRTPLEDASLKSALLYSRATQYRNISEKLIHIFSAIESLLLRNENEPISSALADRLAFAVGQSPDGRLAVAKNVRDVYTMRSRYVHHALETPPEGDELLALQAFLANISQFFINLRYAMKEVNTKDEFIDALELRKYS